MKSDMHSRRRSTPALAIATAMALAAALPARANDPNLVIPLVDTASDEGEHADIIRGADANPVVAFRDENFSALVVAHCDDRNCDALASSTVVDDVGDTGEFISMVRGTDGNPVIAYYDRTGDRIKLVVCGDPGCTAGNLLLAPGQLASTDLQAPPELVLSGGAPMVFAIDFMNNRIVGYRCGNAACSALPIGPLTDIAGGLIVRNVRAVAGTDALPIFAFQTGGHRIEFGRCTTTSCGSPVLAVIDDPIVNDLGNSLDIGRTSQGLPVIAYSDDTDDAVKVATCSDTDCQGPIAIHTIYDSDGTVDEIDVAVGDTTQPVVTFYERNVGLATMKVVGCATPDCSRVASVGTLGLGGQDAGSVAGTTAVAIGAGDRPIMTWFDGVTDPTDSRLMFARCSASDCDDDQLFDDGFEDAVPR